jgi:hypothetical protein
MNEPGNEAERESAPRGNAGQRGAPAPAAQGYQQRDERNERDRGVTVLRERECEQDARKEG